MVITSNTEYIAFDLCELVPSPASDLPGLYCILTAARDPSKQKREVTDLPSADLSGKG